MRKPSVFALALALGIIGASYAQTYPNRPVRIIVPLAPGGGMDSVTRALAQKLGDIFGQTFVVDNRPGAGSQVGLDILSAAAPDGYTLMMVSATTVIHPLLYDSRYDIVRDFSTVSQVTAQGYALVVHPSVPAKSVAEFVHHLRLSGQGELRILGDRQPHSHDWRALSDRNRNENDAIFVGARDSVIDRA